MQPNKQLRRETAMNNVLPIHTPEWRLVETDWHIIVGNRTVAVLMPNSDEHFPHYKWLSLIICDDCPDYGWHAVDFETLAVAQGDIEQWWHHACRGEAYQP
jgi:hypothetical protein